MNFVCEEVSPPKAIRTRASLSARFWRKVTQGNGCWIWQGSINNKGYGRLGLGRRENGKALAHRVSWEINKGKVPSDRIVMHVCDNPPCVNPDHLRLGTRSENQQDMSDKRRNGSQKLTVAQIKEIQTAKAVPGYQYRLAEKFGVAQSAISYHRTRSP